MAVQTYTDTLVVEPCCVCHMPFGITRDFYNSRREDHAWFYCPAGHRQHYTGKSDKEKLREELEIEQRRRAAMTAQRDQAQAEADHQAAVARGYKGALVKTKKRIGRGVCPCCNRHFADVERHMASKHPDIAGG